MFHQRRGRFRILENRLRQAPGEYGDDRLRVAEGAVDDRSGDAVRGDVEIKRRIGGGGHARERDVEFFDARDRRFGTVEAAAHRHGRTVRLAAGNRVRHALDVEGHAAPIRGDLRGAVVASKHQGRLQVEHRTMGVAQPDADARPVERGRRLTAESQAGEGRVVAGDFERRGKSKHPATRTGPMPSLRRLARDPFVKAAAGAIGGVEPGAGPHPCGEQDEDDEETDHALHFAFDLRKHVGHTHRPERRNGASLAVP